jgi:hypothetical protein
MRVNTRKRDTIARLVQSVRRLALEYNSWMAYPPFTIHAKRNLLVYYLFFQKYLFSKTLDKSDKLWYTVWYG